MNRANFVHLARLESDYKAMQRLHGKCIDWKASGEFDLERRIYPSRYAVTYRILAPTALGDRRTHELLIDTSAIDYPVNAQPGVRFTTAALKHPHIYSDGRVCLGGFPLEENLAELCVRLFRFFLFDKGVINSNSIATRSYWEWYQANQKRLPMEHAPLPTITDFRVVDKRGSAGITVKGRRDR